MLDGWSLLPHAGVIVLQHELGTDKFSFSGICFHEVVFQDAYEKPPQHFSYKKNINRTQHAIRENYRQVVYDGPGERSRE